jgi:hypothetical protein
MKRYNGVQNERMAFLLCTLYSPMHQYTYVYIYGKNTQPLNSVYHVCTLAVGSSDGKTR